MSWTTTPVPPLRLTGSGWGRDTPPRATGKGWFQTLEKVGLLTAAGTLTVTTHPTYRIAAAFSGGGELVGQVQSQRYVLAVAFTGLGLPTATVARTTGFGIPGFGADGSLTAAVNDDLTATRRPVTLGHEDMTISIVADGLRPGERVVIDGAARLTDKAKITIATPPDTAPPAAPEKGPAPVARGQRNRGAT